MVSEREKVMPRKRVAEYVKRKVFHFHANFTSQEACGDLVWSFAYV